MGIVTAAMFVVDAIILVFSIIYHVVSKLTK